MKWLIKGNLTKSTLVRHSVKEPVAFDDSKMLEKHAYHNAVS